MRKLLIVDDNAEVREAMQVIFSFYNYSVRTAGDYKNFLIELESFKPEVIVIDVLLSGQDGREICRALREDPLNKEVTIILFSASPKHMKDFEKYGADGIIEKPFGVKELLEKIEAAVQSRMKYLAESRNT